MIIAKKDAVILYVDGDNNPGFSCGPIVYKDSKINVFRVAGGIRDLAGRKCLLLKREFTKFQSRSIQRFIYKGKYRYFDLAQYKTNC